MPSSFQIHGRVQAVYYDVAGSTVVADQAPGASVITLNDVYDFDETGGTALNKTTNETVTYTALDDTAGTLTLSGVTVTTWSAEDFVAPGDGTGQDKRLIASVQDVDEGDVDARIPLRWFDVLAEGTRGLNEGEAVVLDYDESNGEYVLTDILGDTPGVDGTFLNPGSVPTSTATSDGHPPVSSPAPTVQAGIGILFVRWTPLVNADPVTYEVHVSLTNGFTPAAGDATTAGSILGGGAFTLKVDPGTSLPLQYNTTYYIRIIAIDADGAATYSAQASGAPIQVDGTVDIIANSITAASILAQTITADLLSAVLTLSSTIETAATGQRVQIDPTGVTLYAADESVVVQLPTTTVGGVPTPAVFNGQVNATAINVFTSCTIFGATGLQIQPNSHVQLVGGQGDPSIAPSATFSYPSVYNLSFNVDGNTIVGSRVTHWSSTGGSGGATPCYYGTLDTIDGAGKHRTHMVEWLASNGHINRSLQVTNSATNVTTGFGACLIGTEIVALYINGSGTMQFANIARATNTLDSTTTPGTQPGSANLDPTSAHVIGFGSDGTNPYTFSWNNGTKLPNKGKWTMSGGQVSGGVTFTAFDTNAVHLFDPGHANNLGDAGGAINVIGGAWDGTNWYISYSWSNSGGGQVVGRVLQQYDGTTGTIVAKQEIYLPFAIGYFGGGIVYDNTDYYMAGGSGTATFRRIKGTSAFTWDYTLGTAFGLGYTWYNSGAGTPHTAMSPVLSLSLDSGITKAPYQRATVIITVASLPSLATNNLLYAKVGSTTASALLLQSAATHASTDTLQTITFLTYDSGGAVNGGGNTSTFASGGTPSFITGDHAGSGFGASWRLESSGIMRLPVRTTAGSTTTKGDTAFNSDTGLIEVYDGSAVQAWGNARDSEDIYDALNALAGLSGTTGYPIAYTIDPESALGETTMASGDMRGAVFMVKKTCTTSAIGYIISVASNGAITNYLGGTLMSMNSSGDWVFIANTGASAGTSSTNTTGQHSMVWRDAADTVNTTYTLLPGTIYIAAMTFPSYVTTQPKVLCNVPAATAANIQANLGITTARRNAIVTASVTAKRTTNVTSANLSNANNIPLWLIYG